MAGTNINRVIVTGNLTRDPELRSLPSGTSVCSLRIAVNSSRKENDQWVEEPNYFDVTVWGAQGQNCATYLSKGRPVAIDGRLRWREWEASDGSGKRSAVDIVAQSVQFLGSRDGGGGGGQGQGQGQGQGNGFAAQSDVPTDNSDFSQPEPVGASQGSDDDIPF